MKKDFNAGHTMLMRMSKNTVEVEINQAKVPVLLACIHPDADLISYEELLERVATEFTGRVQVWLLNEEINGAFGKHYGIEGTPTFLIVSGGMVRKRLLGQVELATLTECLTRTLN